MRAYTKITGHPRLWDDKHPRWPLKADGTKYIKISKKKRLAMGALGEWPKLYPSVTAVQKPCNFTWINQWYLSAAIRTAAESKTWRNYPDAETCRKVLAKEVSDALSVAADRGTELHDVFAKDVLAATFGSAPETHPVASLVTLLEGLGLDIRTAAVEQSFCCDRFPRMPYAGTIDIVGQGFLVDWKTMVNKRDLHDTEFSQLTMYSLAHEHALELREAPVLILMPVLQETEKMQGAPVIVTAEQRVKGLQLFTAAYELCREVGALPKGGEE